MKAVHYVNFILIFLLLVGICIAEDLLVSSSLKEVQSYCYEIEKMIDSSEDLKNMEIVLKVDNLEEKWLENESKMCYLVNHKSIQEIGQEIAKLKMYIPNNDIEAFEVSIELIKSYCHSYLHFMGANLHNVL